MGTHLYAVEANTPQGQWPKIASLGKSCEESPYRRWIGELVSRDVTSHPASLNRWMHAHGVELATVMTENWLDMEFERLDLDPYGKHWPQMQAVESVGWYDEDGEDGDWEEPDRREPYQPVHPDLDVRGRW